MTLKRGWIKKVKALYCIYQLCRDHWYKVDIIVIFKREYVPIWRQDSFEISWPLSGCGECQSTPRSLEKTDILLLLSIGTPGFDKEIGFTYFIFFIQFNNSNILIKISDVWRRSFKWKVDRQLVRPPKSSDKQRWRRRFSFLFQVRYFSISVILFYLLLHCAMIIEEQWDSEA